MGPERVSERLNDPMHPIENLTLDQIEQMAIVGDTTVQKWGWRNIVRELCRRLRRLQQQRDQSRDLADSESGP